MPGMASDAGALATVAALAFGAGRFLLGFGFGFGLVSALLGASMLMPGIEPMSCVGTACANTERGKAVPKATSHRWGQKEPPER